MASVIIPTFTGRQAFRRRPGSPGRTAEFIDVEAVAIGDGDDDCTADALPAETPGESPAFCVGRGEAESGADGALPS